MVNRYAIVAEGVVINVAVSSKALIPGWIPSETAAIGDRYINGNFVREPPPTPPVEEPSELEVVKKQLSDLTDILIEKGAISRGDVEAKKVK